MLDLEVVARVDKSWLGNVRKLRTVASLKIHFLQSSRNLVRVSHGTGTVANHSGFATWRPDTDTRFFGAISLRSELALVEGVAEVDVFEIFADASLTSLADLLPPVLLGPVQVLGVDCNF